MQKSLGALHFDYHYQITQNGQVLYQDKQKSQVAHTGLAGVFTLWQLDRAKESENKYLDVICQDIVKKAY